MAAASLIAAGTGAANSSDITVTTTPVIVGLKAFDMNAQVDILLKDDAGAYNAFDCLTHGFPTRVLSTAGVYRLSRLAGSSSCGAFSG